MSDLQNDDGWVRPGVMLHKLGNVSAVALTDELTTLQDRGEVESQSVSSGTKPSEQWRICHVPESKN